MSYKEGKKYPGLPESYWVGSCDTGCEYNLIDDVVASGLTKRELFAAMAMQGLISNPDKSYDSACAASDAVAFADALLAELAKEKTT